MYELRGVSLVVVLQVRLIMHDMPVCDAGFCIRRTGRTTIGELNFNIVLSAADV